MAKDDAMVKADAHLVPVDRNRDAIRDKALDKSIDAAADVVSLLVRGGHVVLSAQEKQAETAANWEATHQRIAELDANTRSELQKLKADLSKAKEKTERLRLVLDTVRRPDLPEALAEALARAIDNLTKEL